MGLNSSLRDRILDLWVQGKKQPEIAREVGLGEGQTARATVSVQIQRARKLGDPRAAEHHRWADRTAPRKPDLLPPDIVAGQRRKAMRMMTERKIKRELEAAYRDGDQRRAASALHRLYTYAHRAPASY